MKIAFTGTASTGKTTLVNELLKNEEFKRFKLKFVTTDARSILESLGFKQMDLMTKQQRIDFQKFYFEKKKELESNIDNYITDRSFVDVASYWFIRDLNGKQSPKDKIIEEARIISKSYDLHFYFPYGIIPFDNDGYRSKDEIQRKEIGTQIFKFLKEWGISYIELNESDINKRVQRVIDVLNQLIL
jgi:nicotinamide riboside kinase